MSTTDNSSEMPNAADPSLRFYHSQTLRDKTDTVLQALESNPEHKKHGVAVADLVSELVEVGMEYYFLTPLLKAEVGFVAEKSAKVGLSSAIKLVSSVTRKYITRMDHGQLLVVSNHIKSLC